MSCDGYSRRERVWPFEPRSSACTQLVNLFEAFWKQALFLIPWEVAKPIVGFANPDQMVKWLAGTSLLSGAVKNDMLLMLLSAFENVTIRGRMLLEYIQSCGEQQWQLVSGHAFVLEGWRIISTPLKGQQHLSSQEVFDFSLCNHRCFSSKCEGSQNETVEPWFIFLFWWGIWTKGRCSIHYKRVAFGVTESQVLLIWNGGCFYERMEAFVSYHKKTKDETSKLNVSNKRD